MSESGFDRDPSFDPSQMLRALDANGEFEREELMAFWGVYVEMLDNEELQLTQDHLQRSSSWNSAMQEVIVGERIRRNPPNQVGYYR